MTRSFLLLGKISALVLVVRFRPNRGEWVGILVNIELEKIWKEAVRA
jgi:hypothetical protein